jgi:hypothetical protein
MSRLLLRTERVSNRKCPVCRAALDAATSLSLDDGQWFQDMPDGSVTGCAYCGTLLVVVGSGFRIATDADLADVDPVLRKVLLEIAAKNGV